VTTPVTGPGIDQPDDRDLDDGGLDLTPRTDAHGRTPRSRVSRRWGAIAVLVVLGVALGVIVVQARGATLFYKNADEAVAQRKTLGTKRFRMQGIVGAAPKVGNGDQPTTFPVTYNGVVVKVIHTGSEPALFKAGLPVVVEGHWNASGSAFLSDRLLVKHTENYKKADDGDYQEKHPDRVEPDASATGNS